MERDGYDAMLVVVTAGSAFEASVIAARLNAEGILAQLRGPGTDSQYPVGSVSVLVPAAEAEAACELLLADEIADAFSGIDDEGDADPPLALWLVIATTVAVPAFAILRTLG